MAYNNIYQGKTVLVTGHTGFKGSWLSIWLTMLGSKVIGYSLEPYSPKDNYYASHLSEHIHAEVLGDLRDSDKLEETIAKYQPEIIFHLAAQALVRESYVNPKYTYETNVIGSLNILEATRKFSCVKTVIMITSDKCYENVEQIWGYKESDRMGGYDPYSSSKGCAEILISSYRNSFFNPKDYKKHGKAVASVRAGNVIGGGDWSADRLIPDCIRAIEHGKDIEIRSPNSTRPWEHVLEPLSGYLRLGQKLIETPEEFSQAFNFGPPIDCNKTVWEVVSYLIKYYGKGKVIDISDKDKVHESTLLCVDPSKAYRMLQWKSMFSLKEAIEKTVDWYKAYSSKADDMYTFCCNQINTHMTRGYLWEQNRSF
ncbi:MAG: CDP-glucose 4,6-dehydratase [Succinivibrio sp.]|nr:CDP-glucose 4,6-dehydratase [Succinivibrio sp.]